MDHISTKDDFFICVQTTSCLGFVGCFGSLVEIYSCLGLVIQVNSHFEEKKQWLVEPDDICGKADLVVVSQLFIFR